MNVTTADGRTIGIIAATLVEITPGLSVLKYRATAYLSRALVSVEVLLTIDDATRWIYNQVGA